MSGFGAGFDLGVTSARLHDTEQMVELACERLRSDRKRSSSLGPEALEEIGRAVRLMEDAREQVRFVRKFLCPGRANGD